MGTRSTYRFIETYTSVDVTKSNKLCLVYFQYDGYPNGHPLETAEWLSSGTVVNGFSLGDPSPLTFNGIGCLAAQFIAKYKVGTGGVYMYPLAHRGNSGEDYLYDIIVDSDTMKLTMKVYGYNRKCIFEGTPEEFVSKYKK